MSCRRERCGWCERCNPLGFSVPGAVWMRLPIEARGLVLCLMCFDKLLPHDVEWEREIEFFPVSRATVEEVIATRA